MIEKMPARALFRLRSKNLLTPTAITLYLYFCTGEEGEWHTAKKVVDTTGASERAYRYNLPLLEMSGLVKVIERRPSRNGGGVRVLVRDPSSPEVKKLTTQKKSTDQIREYRDWQYKERNDYYRRKK